MSKPFIAPFYIPEEWEPVIQYLLCLDFRNDNTEAIKKFLERYPNPTPYINLLKRHGLFLKELRNLQK